MDVHHPSLYHSAGKIADGNSLYHTCGRLRTHLLNSSPVIRSGIVERKKRFFNSAWP